ncbi:MAG TPA: hypothetical protein VM618_00135 [Acidimicrobiia bacterium]|nr:hypothetical protein [Acidimicrobiia bacterium]
MGREGRRRILVALEPTVLEGAFGALLGHGERSDVVQLHERRRRRSRGTTTSPW